MVAGKFRELKFRELKVAKTGHPCLRVSNHQIQTDEVDDTTKLAPKSAFHSEDASFATQSDAF